MIYLIIGGLAFVICVALQVRSNDKKKSLVQQIGNPVNLREKHKGMMWVDAEKFFAPYLTDKYRHGLYIPKHIWRLYNDAMLGPDRIIEIPENTVMLIESNRENDLNRESEYENISQHRVAGIKCEEEGDIEGAINEYAQSIILGLSAKNEMLHAFRHSFDRIFILLDKSKRYSEEVEYIEKLLSFNLRDLEREKLMNRLEKVKVKLDKQNRNG